MGLLSVSVSASESYALVSLAGEADTTVCERLREPLVAVVLAGTRNLVVDLSGLSFIDSACLRVLLAVCRMTEEAGGSLGLAAPQPVVARMMELWGADQLIAVYGSAAEAATHRVLPAP